MTHIDHMLYGVPDLAKGMDAFEAMSGVRPVYGGRHEKLGTHNALVSLGEDLYLELIAPDPAQSVPFEEIVFDLGKMQTPRILTWALRTSHWPLLDAHIHTSAIVPGGRTQVDGTVLQWETVRITEPADRSGIVPFVIRWLSQPHPAATSPGGCRLIALTAWHPHPEIFAALFARLQCPLEISRGQTARIMARLDTPRGLIEI